MNIESISLVNFRNYVSEEIVFHPGTNLFFGENAQGKTNILEAVYLCGTTRSHRGSRDKDMIRFGQEESHIRMLMKKRDVSYRIDMHLKQNHAKGIAINGVPIKRASELVGLGYFVFFSPEDLNMIKNGPAERRRLIDMEMSQLSGIYLHELSVYQRALMQRNSLLKEISFHPEYLDMLDVWDEQLVDSGKKIMSMRSDFIEELSMIMGDLHFRLSGKREHMIVSYEKNVEPDDFADRLRQNREKDIRLKTTNAGPHRDDLLFETQDIDIRKFGSQGQQRTTALSLKLSEIILVREKTGDMPVLLLDDVLSELDQRRQGFLLENINTIQTMITGTGTEHYRENHFQIDRLFEVSGGKVYRKDAKEEIDG